MKESYGIIFSRYLIQKERTPNLSNTSVSADTLIANNLSIQRLQSYCSSSAHQSSGIVIYTLCSYLKLLVWLLSKHRALN